MTLPLLIAPVGSDEVSFASEYKTAEDTQEWWYFETDDPASDSELLQDIQSWLGYPVQQISFEELLAPRPSEAQPTEVAFVVLDTPPTQAQVDVIDFGRERIVQQWPRVVVLGTSECIRALAGARNLADLVSTDMKAFAPAPFLAPDEEERTAADVAEPKVGAPDASVDESQSTND